MSEINSEEIDHYLPQHPLPEAIRKMERDETICRYSKITKCSKILNTFLYLHGGNTNFAIFAGDRDRTA